MHLTRNVKLCVLLIKWKLSNQAQNMFLLETLKRVVVFTYVYWFKKYFLTLSTCMMLY